MDEIDTSKYENDFSIIVNLKSFGQIQCDLSTLLNLENEDDVYPWAVQLNDLETFLLTLIAKGKKPDHFIYFLLLRELLHGKLICADESEICGGFLEGKITKNIVNRPDVLVTTPDLADVFDKQYYKGLGLKNEKYMAEKGGKKHIFL